MTTTELICIDPNISTLQWIKCLLWIDKDIMDQSIYDDSNKIIIISLPYKLEDIKQALNEFITTTFTQESMLFCSDVIMQFIAPNKQFIQNTLNLTSSKIDNNPKPTVSRWSKERHDELIATQSLIIINTRNGMIVSLPRSKNDLDLKWKMSWDDEGEFNNPCNKIFAKIGNEYLADNFKVYQNFSSITLIGYLCDNGEIIKTDVLTQNKKNCRIFVHFNTDSKHFGRKYEWLETPNERICPPPKNKPQEESFATYHYNEQSTFIGSNRFGNDDNEDQDLQQAIAASLQDQ